MGTRSSSQALLAITTEAEKYQAGTIVSGEIVLTLKSETTLEKLKLQLKVREKMRMEAFPLCGITESQAFYRVSYSIQLPSFKAGVRREGVHRFPFHFQIVPNFPGSFLYAESVKKCRCAYLRYFLVAQFKQSGLKAKRSLEIYQAKPALEIPYEVKDIVPCQVCGQESEIKLQIVLEKSAYAAGETAAFAVLIEPKAVREFRLKVRLYRDLAVSSGAIAFNRLDKVGLSQCVSQVLQPCEPVVVHLSFPLCATGRMCGSPTLQSRFIKCEYFFLLEVLARGDCGVLKRSTKVPIGIYDARSN